MTEYTHRIRGQVDARGRMVRVAANATIAGLWLWLYRAVFEYLGVIFRRDDFRTNQILLVAVLGMLSLQAGKGSFRPRLDAPPQSRPLPAVLALGASILYLLVERFLDVNTLSATLFGLASYGLLGLWMHPTRWKRGLPAALLLIGTLPFGEHLQTFAGYPMRIVTATIVSDGLNAAGVASSGVDTILVFENGISQVDVPCSGVKSLWTGMLFLLAATWIERRRLDFRWLMIAAVFAGLLFAANVIRVGLLVAVGQVAGWQLVAEMLHVPLGVLGFVAACAAALWMLRRSAEAAVLHAGRASEPSPHGIDTRPIAGPSWFSPALAVTILAMALAYAPRPQTGLRQVAPVWHFPPEVTTEPLPLKPDEVQWLTREGADSATRLRFRWSDISGTMILINSHTWRAHHRPERCFEVYGLKIGGSRTIMGPGFPLRTVELSDPRRGALYRAVYWFQSAGRTTDDYGTRMWADLTSRRDAWILVSILFDGPQDPDAAGLQALLSALHGAVARTLDGGSPT